MEVVRRRWVPIEFKWVSDAAHQNINNKKGRIFVTWNNSMWKKTNNFIFIFHEEWFPLFRT